METALVTAIRDLLFTGAVAHGNPKYSSKVVRRARGKSTSSAHSMTPQAKSDLLVTPPNFRIPSRVPRQVSNIPVWNVVKVATQIQTSASAVNEVNFAFSLNTDPQAGSWTTLFDQWCIPQFSISYESLTPPGLTSIPPKIYTALDFDNQTNITTVTNITDFATCEANTLEPTTQFVRSVRPCTKITTTGAASLARSWQDSAQPGALWFGIRTMVDNTNSTVVYNCVSCVATIWFAFRNQI